MQETTPKQLKEYLNSILKDTSHQTFTVEEIRSLLEEKGQALACLILSLPFVFPMPLPGLSIAFGIVLMALGSEMLFGKKIHLPSRLANKKISRAQLEKVFGAFQKVFVYIEKWTKPRGHFMFVPAHRKRWQGIGFIITGFLLALPLPPGTNAPPGFTTFILALGLIEQDAVILILGDLLVLLNVILFSFLGVYGFTLFEKLRHWLFG